MINNAIQKCLLWPEARPTGLFKQSPDDFIVEEILEWEFKGEGEHIFLWVEKTNCNTQWVAKQLALFYGVPPRDVGYSGLKDRHAITRQYFSVRLPGVKPGSYDIPTHDEYQVLSHVLHDKKLKRGNHKANRFTITVKAMKGDTAHVEERFAYIRDNGCPNLFDSQRFGHNNNNLNDVIEWANGVIEPRKRDEKGILLSAFRSAIFNQQLAQRLHNDTWNSIIENDVVLLDGSNSFFTVDSTDDEIARRVQEHDIHPAGILVGEEDDFGPVSEQCEIFDEEKLRILMKREHLTTGYRPLRLIVKDFTWKISNTTCVIRMTLPTGAYASGVVKQIFDI